MSELVFTGRVIYGFGVIEGEVIVIRKPISFLGDVDGEKGIIKINGEEIKIKDKVLIIPYTKGSTVGPYIMYQLAKTGNKPRAILSVKGDTLLIIGCVISEIPLIIDLPEQILNINSGSRVKIDFSRGLVYVYSTK